MEGGVKSLTLFNKLTSKNQSLLQPAFLTSLTFKPSTNHHLSQLLALVEKGGCAGRSLRGSLDGWLDRYGYPF